VRVWDDQGDAAETTGDQGGKKATQPAPSPVVITSKPSTSRCPSVLTPDAMTTATLTMRPPSLTTLGRRVEPDVGMGPGVEGPGAKGLDLLVKLSGHARGLGLGEVLHPQGLDQAFDAPRRDPAHVALGHDLG
jgi:hypothetical protein